MDTNFRQRFTATADADPMSLQLLQTGLNDFATELFEQTLKQHHPDFADVQVELIDAADDPTIRELVSADGPATQHVGLVTWGCHCVKMATFNAQMPYGPMRTCVEPAMMPQELKQAAAAHNAHTLIYYGGTEADPMERFVALAMVAGTLARWGGIVILNEEARVAVPASDLIPDPNEDIADTIYQLPIPYLLGGFVKLDVGDVERPWVRTFANHRLNLPNLSMRLSSQGKTSAAFQLIAGLLGYLIEEDRSFAPGDSVDLGNGETVQFREPTELEWFLDSPGVMLVIERSATDA